MKGTIVDILLGVVNDSIPLIAYDGGFGYDNKGIFGTVPLHHLVLTVRHLRTQVFLRDRCWVVNCYQEI